MTITSSVNATAFMISGYINNNANGFTTPELSGNKIVGYKYPFVISNDAYPTISGNDVSGCVFKGIGLQGTFYTNYTLGDYNKLPYQLSYSLYIYGNTFTIPSGLSIDMQANSINVNAKNSGVLVDRSEAFLNASGVTFTGSSTGSGLIQYNGFLGTGQAEFWSGGTMDKCTFKNIRFVFNEYSKPKFEQVQISGVSTDAFTVNKTGKPSITNSDFYNVTGYGIKNLGTNNIEAQNCYWGDSSGPNHTISNPTGKGCKVSDKVNYVPWVIKPNQEIKDEIITEKLYPVFKYHLSQSGFKGIMIGLNIIGFGIAEVENATLFILNEYLENCLEYSITEFIDLLIEDPKYITCCMKYNGSNLSNPNSDFVFLLEYDDKIQIGKPFTATYQKSSIDMDNTLIPPGFGILTNYQVSTLPSNYMTVYEAGYKLKPQFFSPKLNITTVGVVNGFINHSGKTLMILQNYRPIEYFIIPLFEIIPQIDMQFIAVDVSNQVTRYDIGSLVEVTGQSVNISPLIKQEYESWYSKKVIQYISPSSVKPINAKPANEIIYNTSLLSMFYSKDGKIVALKFPELKQYPDLKFIDKNLSIYPKELITIGKSYTVQTAVTNNGNVEADFGIKAYIKSGGILKQLKQFDIQSLKPGDKKLVQFNWIPDNSIDIKWGTGEIYFSITSSSPIESNLSNNTIFSEFNLNVSDYYKYLVATGYCPVTLKVTAPDGQYIDINSNLINGAEYIVDDFDGDGYLDNRVFIPETTDGEYKVDVIPTEDAKPEDSYTLIVRAENQEIVYADSVKIQEIPVVPYSYIYTSNHEIEENKELNIYSIGNQIYIQNNSFSFDEFKIDIYDIDGRLLHTDKKILSGITQIDYQLSLIKQKVLIVRLLSKGYSKSYKLFVD